LGFSGGQTFGAKLIPRRPHGTLRPLHGGKQTAAPEKINKTKPPARAALAYMMEFENEEAERMRFC
jgi:hypothetical protein